MDQLFSSEAAKVLGIGASTLRNYAATLESKGYTFKRGTNNGRIFQKEDLERMAEMSNNISVNGMTLDEAATTIANNCEDQKPDQKENMQVNNEEFERLLQHITQLEEQQAKFADVNLSLAKQVERLTEKMEERERDQLLFQRLQEAQEKKKRKGIAFFRPSMIGGKK
ncbi:MerR family transcriptional regulator [Bacillus sp. FJAT-50079]|uniref:MerR family transcriptional regulator n=1 Tax=Bacillus sp. FJAT-50079 TaxID=2833577 RepID=UPI001BC995C3|nr:MerR family transcriptional regulator [Bacillus sp. FJAT-50079]